MYSLQEIDHIVERSVMQMELTGEPQALYEPIEYMISIGGKRVRPRLCLSVYNLFSDRFGKDVIYPALALEIFHGFTLVHDDIMDKADVRRNQPTVHRKWNENVAILSGDVMFIKSYQYLQEVAPEKMEAVFRLFSDNAAKVCEGQQYDMDYEYQKVITIDEYLNMIGYKTGALLACSAKMGAILAGVPENVADSFYRFAWLLGIAFQITDDYLDTFGNYSVFGKRIGGDIVQNKKTWLLVETMRVADDAQRAEMIDIMEHESDEETKIARMQKLYIGTGVKNGAVKAIDEYYRKALEALSGAGLNSEQFEQMKEFASRITYRDK